MSQFVGSRFGQDLPSRIATSAPMLMEATDILPGEDMVQPLIPFYPGGIVSGGNPSGSISTESAWESGPTEFDLTFYEGDDVVIPLYLQDPNNPTLDMSDQSDWDWHAQVRQLPHHSSTLIHEFSVDSQYYPPGDYDPLLGTTLVSMFLPRELNKRHGEFFWELYSISPYVFSSDYPQPDDWPNDEVWPPTDTLRTWLQGACKIKLRTGTTDELLGASAPPGGNTSVVLPVVGGVIMTVGPNGRVP